MFELFCVRHERFELFCVRCERFELFCVRKKDSNYFVLLFELLHINIDYAITYASPEVAFVRQSCFLRETVH